jgi:ABC-type sugar transport system substrate-binding protein
LALKDNLKTKHLGVPTIAIASHLDDFGALESAPLTMFGMDSTDAGEKAAEQLLNSVTDKSGLYVCINHVENNANFIEICNAFRDVILQETGASIEIFEYLEFNDLTSTDLRNRLPTMDATGNLRGILTLSPDVVDNIG